MELTRLDVLRRLGLWTAICSFSAAPSFLWAAHEFNIAAMLTGVACFILMLTAVTCTRRFERFKRRPFMRRTLYIGYGARVGLSILFPVGMFIDLYPGMLSVGLVEAVGIAEHTFVGTLLITLIQGTLLNVLISIFMLCIYGFQRLVCPKPIIAEHACERCGYDLQGSTRSAMCPECGTPITETPERRAA